MSDIVPRLLAASHDERLSTGALYREACKEITRLRAALWMVRPYVYGLERIKEIDSALEGAPVQPSVVLQPEGRGLMLTSLPQPDTILVPIKATQDMLYAMAEQDGWVRGDRDHPMLTQWEDYWLAALAAVQSAKARAADPTDGAT